MGAEADHHDPGPLERAEEGTPNTSSAPKLRGWLHLGLTPLVLAGGLVLVLLAPTSLAQTAAIVYAVTSLLLFGISAVYHRGRWTPHVRAVLRRLDHSNIYLIIAGTYTPLALLALDGTARVAVLAVVWAGALLGVAFRIFWINAPRWLYTPLYVALGWVAIFFLPQILRGSGSAVIVLVVVGGLLYTAGGVVYALKRPRLSPRWFGFHEVFHAFTVLAYAAQYVAVSLVTYRFA